MIFPKRVLKQFSPQRYGVQSQAQKLSNL